MATDYTPEDYRETVEVIAQEILQDEGLDPDNWHDRIHEDVDSNAYIIMYAGPPVVKEASDNFPDDLEEVFAMAGPDAGFDTLLATAAYMAMEQDVQEKCRELASSAVECAICKTVKFDEVLVECEDCEDEICDDCATQDDSGTVFCKECYKEDEDASPNELEK